MHCSWWQVFGRELVAGAAGGVSIPAPSSDDAAQPVAQRLIAAAAAVSG